MSVATQLGLHDPDEALLAQACQQWRSWGEEVTVLRVVDDLLDLPSWIEQAPKPQVDDVLHALAVLGSPTGGDDLRAAGALAWVLLPGACLTAHRLRSVTPRIDEVVGAQLWLEVRGFPWHRLRKVAANITMNTRRGVLRDLGVGEYLRQVDPAWARAVPLDPAAGLWGVLDAAAVPAAVPASTELAEVLGWALGQGVISSQDLDLLFSLAVAADRAGVTRAGCGLGGLCSLEVARTVAAARGISSATVRRRAAHSLRAVASAYTARDTHPHGRDRPRRQLAHDRVPA